MHVRSEQNPSAPQAARLLAITDRKLTGPLTVAKVDALAAELGARLSVQVREKDLESDALYDLTDRIAHVAVPRGATVVINGRLDIAKSLGVGVHLPEDGLSVAEARALLGPDQTIGRSVHSLDGVLAAVQEGASYVTLSPIFETPGKGSPLGIETLSEAVTVGRGRVEIYALGGVDEGNADQVRATGASGIAAIRSAWRINRSHIRAFLLDGAPPRPT